MAGIAKSFSFSPTQPQQSQPAYPTLEGRDSIRLLHLSPGSGNDLLSGKLVPVSVSQLPEYEALSYAWGSATKNHRFSTPSGKFPITESLQSALRRLRYPDRVRILWADALCINQSDNEEKGRQIMLMPKIYSIASSVLVYLGDEADGSDRVIDLIYKIGSMKSISSHDSDLVNPPLEEYGLPPAGSREWVAFRDFWRRPWFRRVWVIQEFILAKDLTMICGSWERSWQFFWNAAERLVGGNLTNLGFIASDREKRGEAAEGIYSLATLCIYRLSRLKPLASTSNISHSRNTIPQAIDTTQIATNLNPDSDLEGSSETISNLRQIQIGRDIRTSKTELLSLIQSTKSYHVAEPKDRLFALLSLAEDLNQQDLNYLQPDYAKPIELIICRYASVLVQNGYCLQILYQASTRPGSSVIPSWVGDWTAHSPSSHSLSAICNEEIDIYQAAACSKLHANVIENEGVLIISGGFVDTIKSTTGASIVETGTEKNFVLATKTALALVDYEFDRLKCYPTGEPLEEVKWRTLIANSDSDSEREAPPWMGDQFALWRRLLQTTESKTRIFHSGTTEYVLALSAVRFYQLCVTQNGYVGLVPMTAKEGDQIAVFLGAAVPFILRKSKQRPEMFRLIGGCYIHGIMKGEAMRLPHWQEEEIQLH